MVLSGNVTCSPKASPGCSGDGEAGPIGAGIGSLTPGLGCAAATSTVNGNARTASVKTSWKGDITALRRSRRSGDSPALVHILAGLWPILEYSPYKPGKSRAKHDMSALANQSFVKMNGVGNEIVVVDLRARGGKIEADEARAAARPDGAPYDQLMALYPPRTPGTDAFIRIFNNDGSEAGASRHRVRR